MFLMKLKEENKENFLKLCMYAIMSDNKFAEEEKALLFAYCRELNLEEKIPDTEIDLDVLIDNVKDSASLEEKKIILIELLGLVKTDGEYDEHEKEFTEKVANGIGIEVAVLSNMEDVVIKYMNVCKELFEIVKV